MKSLSALVCGFLLMSATGAASTTDKTCPDTLRELLRVQPAPPKPDHIVAKARDGGMKVKLPRRAIPRAFKYGSLYQDIGEGTLEEAALSYQVSFFYVDRPQQFNLLIPASGNQQVDSALFERMKETMVHFSARLLKDVDEVVLNPYARGDDLQWKRVEVKKGVVTMPDLDLQGAVLMDANAAPSGKILVNIYPAGYLLLPPERLIFEFHSQLGQAWATKHFEDSDLGQRWLQAIRSDANSITENSGQAPLTASMDFALATALYIRTDGGIKNTELLEKLPHRFGILDSLMEVDVERKAELLSQRYMRQALEKNDPSSGIIH